MSQETTWSLYATNEEAWSAMLSDCAKAEKSIALEQFIFYTDDFGNRLINICTERAKAGVEVRFLWDAAGSFTFWGSSIADDLRNKGISLRFWRTIIPGYFKVPNIRSWFLRNHRRTLVIDGKVGYTGSICVKDAMKNWRDTNARFEGPIVGSMQNAFDRMWARTGKAKRLPKRRFPRYGDWRYVTNYPAPGRRDIYRALAEAIRGAEKHIYITTPYFVPTHRLLRLLRSAAKRDVDVRIILPERSDQYPTLDIAARSYFMTLLHAGVRIFLYPGHRGNGTDIIHGKTVVIDGEWSTVGSLNMDNVSLLYNFEANIISTDPDFAGELASHFKRDMALCKEVLIHEWRSRFFIEKLPEFAIRLVRKFL